MRVAIYARVSTEEQFVINQLLSGREYASKHDLEIVAEYSDDGVSGTVPFPLRAAGQQLLQDARAGRFQTLLVFKLDRLGRDTLETLMALRELESVGIAVRSMTEPELGNTPVGKLMRTILSATSTFERDVIIERSVEATRQLAAQGVWLGGIVPYGYRVEGVDRAARLVVDEEPLPTLGLSPAEIVRRVYQWLAEEQRSTYWIAAELTSMGVPPRYIQDGREVRRNTRKTRTASHWRAARIRNMVIETTYKGVHTYGKRGKRVGPITRDVAAIVSETTWERAQQTLHSNMRFSPRNSRREYLLRGLITCGTCGLNYSGTGRKQRSGRERRYYVCNGYSQARGIYGEKGQRCPSKMLHQEVEQAIWEDVERFLRNPGDVLEAVAERYQDQASLRQSVGTELAILQRELAGQEQERERVISLFRKGVLSEADVEQQFSTLSHERDELQARIHELEHRTLTLAEEQARLVSVEALLNELRAKLDSDLTFATKRRVVEALVHKVIVEPDGSVRALYRFTPITVCTDTDS